MGAAMSRAADLEVSLIHALLALDFLSASAQTIKQTRFKNFDRKFAGTSRSWSKD